MWVGGEATGDIAQQADFELGDKILRWEKEGH
jgi:hypothetical protein